MVVSPMIRVIAQAKQSTYEVITNYPSTMAVLVVDFTEIMCLIHILLIYDKGINDVIKGTWKVNQ